MMTSNKISRWQQGVTLIEALVAIAILSFGILAIAKLGSIVLNLNGDAKTKAQAVALAEGKLEEFRSLIVEKQFLDISTRAQGSAESIFGYSGSNTSTAFSRWWNIGTTTEGKPAEVFVSWVDRGGTTQTVVVRSYLAWDDPAKGAAWASSTSITPGAGAKSPTGRAKLGSGVASDSGITPPNNGIAEERGNDNKWRLVASNGNVLLTAQVANERFSKVSGKVYVDQQSFGKNKSPSKDVVFIVISDASYCQMTPENDLTNYGNGGVFKYFSYTCYLGAAWYGNIGVIRTDDPNTSSRVCVGDPNVTPTSYSLDSDSRHPSLSTNRMYRGYNGINSTGIGIDSSGNYTAAEYDGHDFLLTSINGNPTDPDCKPKLQLNSTANPNVPFGNSVTVASPATATTASPWGNPGRFFCLSSVCPSPLPTGVAPEVAITASGSITALGGATVTNMAMDSVGCVISGSDPTYTYTCTVSLQGFTGGTWTSTLDVTTGGVVCPTGLSGTANPLPTAPSTDGQGIYTFNYVNQPTDARSPTLNFKVAADASSCPI